MKKFLLTAGFYLLISSFLMSQDKSLNVPYNVVFDLTSGDTIQHRVVLRWIKLISETNPDARLELVVYGNALPVFVKDKSIAGNEISRLAAGKKVNFRACAVTMKRDNITKEQLVPGVETVPDAIYEIISRQSEGWGYIKVSQ